MKGILLILLTISTVKASELEHLLFASSDNVQTDAFILSINGKTTMETYKNGYSEKTRHRGWSMAKSLLNNLVGIAQKNGILNKDMPIKDCIKNLDSKYSDITIAHLLKMTSGIKWNETYEGSPFNSDVVNMLFLKNGYKDMTSYVLTKDREAKADVIFNYSSGSSILLTQCVQNRLIEPIHQFLKREMFDKLGVTSMVLENDQSGLWVGSSYMYASLKDYLRWGEFLLRKGEGLLPDNWIEWSITPNVDAPNKHKPNQPYGAGFWLNRASPNSAIEPINDDIGHKLFMARGHNGQSIIIIPNLNLVAVRLANDKAGGIDLKRYLAALVKEARSEI